MTPLVAIVGRPNVGKSTLFNRLAGKKLAIVHDAPGVTRDRHYADTHLHGRDLVVIDTGGFDPTTDDPMGQGIARHVQAAIEEADVVVCVLDGSAPPTGPDRDAVELLRRSGKPVVYAANKVDSEAKALETGELYSLGIDELVGISALHGRNTAQLEARIVDLLPPVEPTEGDEGDDEEIIRIALVGRPNAGKSSLFNRLTGSERSLVDNRPGTTRDPIDSKIEFEGNTYLVVDTAGIRRKAKVSRGVEEQSVLRSIRAVTRARVVVLMCDVTEGIAEQDMRLLGLCAERGRAIVVGLNKADLISNRELEGAIERAKTELSFARWAPVLGVSAQSGKGVARLMRHVDRAGHEMAHRVGTSELNRFFEKVISKRPPPTKGGRAPRIYYITQTNVNPPTFVAMCSSPDHVAESYRRFVANQIRKEFGFEGVPLRVYYRKRGRKDD